MRNISFDNPLWLLLLIPLFIGVLVPFFIAIRKDNKSKSVIASLVIHLLIALLVGAAAAGTVITTVITETHVYVVADLSYSAERSLDEVDEMIAEIKASLPENGKMGVICFGKDYVLHTPLGGELLSVKDAKVDNTATDISAALQYAGSLFTEGALKRVVLLTDGMETVREDVSGMVAAVEQLAGKDIAVDAVYLDSNLPEGLVEAQLTGVHFTEATYLNHAATAGVLVQSNTETEGIVSLYRDGAKMAERAVTLTKGYNQVEFSLPTDIAGSFSYEVEVMVAGDSSDHNNHYGFTHRVSADIKVLLITENAANIAAAKEFFGKRAAFDVMYVAGSTADLNAIKTRYEQDTQIHIASDPTRVPCSVEELCRYDEIVLANIDVRKLQNVTAFIESTETVVSLYGKSLLTVGDNKFQNKVDETLKSLEDMLPVKYGNNAQDPALYTILIDVSRSMFQASRLTMAKQAAVHLLNVLQDTDEVLVVYFWGDMKVLGSGITTAAHREELAREIYALEPQQGTSIGKGLAEAVERMIHKSNTNKQVMLISDGMKFSTELVPVDGRDMTPEQVAAYMGRNGIKVSTLNPYNSDKNGIQTLQSIAQNSGGEYYYLANEKQLETLIFDTVSDDVTETVINKPSLVHIKRDNDEALKGIAYLPEISGYIHSKAKSGAREVLTVDYLTSAGATVEVPLYAWWKYGNGRVASFTSDLTGSWAAGWQGVAGQTFYTNLFEVSIPTAKIDRPYSIYVNYDGIYSNLEVIPGVPEPFAGMEVTLTYPDGSTVTEILGFDASRYFYRFETPQLGFYGMQIVYTTKTGVFEENTNFYISYSPEYDSFANFDASMLHAAVRHRGTVSEGRIPDLSNDDARVATYRLTFTAPFMIAAVVLFVLDIIVRKIKWADIKGLFKPLLRKKH